MTAEPARKILALRVKVDPTSLASVPGGPVAVDELNTLDKVPLLSGYEILVADYDELSVEDRARLHRACLTNSRPRVVLITGGKEREALNTLVSKCAISHVLARRLGDLNDKELSVTLQKMLTPGSFGLERYVEWGVDSRKLQVASEEDRQIAITSVRQFAESKEINSRFASLLMDAADELITNALKHAAERVPFPANIEVQFGFNGRWLGISVSDCVGALRARDALEAVSKGFRGGPPAALEAMGRSKLGLARVLSSVSKLELTVEAGRRTEVIGLINIWGSHREFVSGVKAFNLYFDEPR